MHCTVGERKPLGPKLPLMPIGIDQRRAANLVQPIQFGLGQPQIDRCKIVLNCASFRPPTTSDETAGRVSNHASTTCAAETPRATHFDQRINDIPQPLRVADRRFGPARELPRSFGGGLTAPVLARKQPCRQRRPDQNAKTLIYADRQ